MDASRFDVWTRRRVGLASGGALASLVMLAALPAADAKKKKRKKKKRCRKLGATCTPGAKRKCCGDLLCAQPSMLDTLCCKGEGASCQEDFECCPTFGCNPATSQCALFAPSDRALKTNFGSVDAADMLQRVRELPISTWNYTSDDASVRHIGPMAQDFAAAFGVGVDDRHIHPIDGQGVALAAIQGLVAELERLREENRGLAERIAALEQPRG